MFLNSNRLHLDLLTDRLEENSGDLAIKIVYYQVFFYRKGQDWPKGTPTVTARIGWSLRRYINVKVL